MSIKKELLWEKWRPRKIEDMVLLPRIRSVFENGVNMNTILYGNFGTGKTTLARVLVGKYSNKSHLEINSSLSTSIDVLRGDIEKFCKTVPIMESDDPIKYVILDEFERTSIQFQDAFKAFIEHYHSTTRFILITNHINKISEGIKSRFASVGFDPKNKEEEKYLKTEIFKRIMEVVAPAEGLSIDKNQLIDIIKKNYPDMRSMFVDIQTLKYGEIDSARLNHSNADKMDLYKILYDKNQTFESIHHFILGKFGPDKMSIVFDLLGSPFVNWSFSERRENIDKLFKLSHILSEYKPKLTDSSDPMILGMSLIGKYRELLA